MAGASFAAIALVVPLQCYEGLRRHPSVWVSCVTVGCIAAIELALVAARG
jgi:hypothetical protein